MRKKTISSDVLAEIKGGIEDGTYDIKGAANEYSIPVSTLYRSLRREYGAIPVSLRIQSETTVDGISKIIEAEGLDIAHMTSHEKMLAMDKLAESFPAQALCKAFDVLPESFAKHRRNLAIGINSHKKREQLIAETIATIISARNLVQPQVRLLGPYAICRVLRDIGVVTSPQLVRRILDRMWST